jgi:hypothetical protein
MKAMGKVVLLTAFVFTAFGGACGDNLLDDQEDAQGDEVAGVPVGQFHRTGQRCVTCHREDGAASAHPFALGGTIFAQPGRDVGVSGVDVLLTDSDGSKFTAHTNCVGNFFIKTTDWTPRYPIIVDIQKNGVRRSMQSPIGREGDCAACHRIAVSDPLSQMPHIYLFSADEPGSPNGDPTCAVAPVRKGTQ